jgi:hypothetical protein
MSALAALDAHVQEYRTRGFTIIRNAIPPQELEPFRLAIGRAIEALAQELLAQGKITELHQGLPIEDRLTRILGGQEFGRSWDQPVYGPELHALIQQPGIIRALRGILGPDICFDGGHRLRPKLPHSELTAFPWHQDSQYYGVGTEHLHIVSVWVPLVDVDEDNGCLYFIPGSQTWGLLQGARGADMNIRSEIDVESRGVPVAAPMRRGDIVLFSNLTVHGSKVNHTDRVRWSIDLRYSAARSQDPATAEVARARELYSDRLEGMDPGFAVSGIGSPVDFPTWNARQHAVRTRSHA